MYMYILWLGCSICVLFCFFDLLVCVYHVYFFVCSCISGISYALSYAPSIVTVSEYFDKRRSLANGISVAGSGLGNLLVPLLARHLLDEWGLGGSLIIYGGIGLHVCVSGLLMRPVSFYTKSRVKNVMKDSEEPPGLANGVVGHRGDMAQVKPRQLAVLQDEDRVFGVRGAHSSCDDIANRVREDVSKGTVSCDNIAKLTRHSGSTLHIGAFYAGLGDIACASIQSLPDHMGHNITIKQSQSRDSFKNSKEIGLASNVNNVASVEVSHCEKQFKSCYQKLCFLPPNAEGYRRPMFDWALLFHPVFLLYTASIFFSSMGYTSILMMVPPRMRDLEISKTYAAMVVSVTGGADLSGRIFFGWFSDLEIFPKQYGYMAAMCVSGVSVLFYPIAHELTHIVVVSLFFGLFGGAWIALVPVMLVDALGLEKLPNSFGLSLVAQGISMLIGFTAFGRL